MALRWPTHNAADDYEHKFQKINRQLIQLQVKGHKFSNDYDFHIAQSLSQHILDQPISSRIKIPQVEPYDGSTDPIDHLESYKALVMIQRTIDILFCIGFLVTL